MKSYVKKGGFLTIFIVLVCVVVILPSYVSAGSGGPGDTCVVPADCQPGLWCWNISGFSPPYLCGTQQVTVSSCTATPSTANRGQSVSFNVSYSGGIAAITTPPAQYWVRWHFDDGSTDVVNSTASNANSTNHPYSVLGQKSPWVKVSYGQTEAAGAPGISCNVNSSLTPPGVNVVALPNGQPCTDNSQCQSGYCNNATPRVCANQPATPYFSVPLRSGVSYNGVNNQVAPGGTAELRWMAVNVDQCTGTGPADDTGFNGNQPIQSGTTLNPSLAGYTTSAFSTTPGASRTYSISCSFEGGTPISSSVTITVGAPAGACTRNSQCSSGQYCNTSVSPAQCSALESGNCVVNSDCTGIGQICSGTPGPTGAGVGSCVSGGGGGTCGDSICNNSETTATCPSDCTAGPPGGSGSGSGIRNPLQADDIYTFLASALRAFVNILIPIIVIFIIITGLMFILARGNPTKLALAKTALLYTVIGAAVVLGAWVLAQMISSTITAIQAP